MARQKSMINVKGKLGPHTYTTGKQGNFVRENAELTAKQKKDIGERKQNIRMALFSQMLRPVKNVLQHYNGGHLRGGFWADMSKPLWKESTNHRVLLFKKLDRMEVDPRRKFSDSCPRLPVEIDATAKTFSIDIDLSSPAVDRKEYNSYYLQFIMIVFDEDSNECRFTEESTGWLSPNDRTPKFTTMKFPRKKTDSEYVLACRLVFGINSKETGFVTDTRMCILTTGTVSAAGNKILKQREQELIAARNAVKEVPVAKEKKKLVIRNKR